MDPLSPDGPPPLPRDAYAAPAVSNPGVPIWVTVVIVLGVGLLTGVVGFGVGFVMGFAAGVMDDYDSYDVNVLEDVDLAVVAPKFVGPGETFLVVATITNNDDTTHSIDMIDIYASALAGATVKSSDPTWDETFVTDEYTSYYYTHTIAPGESLTITFSMVAGDNPGTFIGDFDVWFVESGSYVTQPLEIMIEAQ